MSVTRYDGIFDVNVPPARVNFTSPQSSCLPSDCLHDTSWTRRGSLIDANGSGLLRGLIVLTWRTRICRASMKGSTLGVMSSGIVLEMDAESWAKMPRHTASEFNQGVFSTKTLTPSHADIDACDID